MNGSDIERHVTATATLIGLPLQVEHRAGVLRYFAIASAMAALVMEQALTPQDEPAEVFVPVSPAATEPP